MHAGIGTLGDAVMMEEEGVESAAGLQMGIEEHLPLCLLSGPQ